MVAGMCLRPLEPPQDGRPGSLGYGPVRHRPDRARPARDARRPHCTAPIPDPRARSGAAMQLKSPFIQTNPVPIHHEPGLGTARPSGGATRTVARHPARDHRGGSGYCGARFWPYQGGWSLKARLGAGLGLCLLTTFANAAPPENSLWPKPRPGATSEEVVGDRVLQVPEAAYVEQVYPEANFNALGIE